MLTEDQHRATSPGRVARRVPTRVALLALVPVLWALFSATRAGELPLEEPDSASYLTFHPSRTAGYPAFIAVVRGLGLPLAAIAWLQLVFFAVAATVFAHALAELALRVTGGTRGRWILAMVMGAEVVILGNPEVTKYWREVLTEAPATATLMVMAAAAMSFATHERARDLAWCSAATGLAITLRPVHYALAVPLCGLVVFAVARRKAERWRLLAAGLVPLVSLLLLAAGAYAAKHGTFRTQSFLGMNLYGKVALLPSDPVPAGLAHREDVEVLVTTMRPLRAAVEEAPDFRSEFLLRTAYADIARFTLGEAVIGAGGTVRERDGRLLAIAKDVIRAWPERYLREVALTDWGLWSLFPLADGAGASTYDGYVERANVPYGAMLPVVAAKPVPMVIVSRGLMACGGLLALLGVASAFLLRRAKDEERPVCIVAAYVGLALHAHVFLTALLQAAIPRYMFIVWPLVVLEYACAAVVLLGRVQARQNGTAVLPSEARQP